MKKYAFINSETLHPDSYQGNIVSSGISAHFCGVNSLELACTTVKRLVIEGYTEIDLCGDFNEVMAAEISAYTDDEIVARPAVFGHSEEEKFAKLSVINPWGIIIMDQSLNLANHYICLHSDECDTFIAGVANMAQAYDAAIKMTSAQTQF